MLVVDDEPDICDSVYNLLRLRYEVLRATSAAAAVEIMRQREVHVIMTDQRMPVVTGVEMLRSVRSEHPEAIRMLFTGYTDLRSVIDAINLGHIYRYLMKPFAAEELEAAVADAVIEHERISGRGIALSRCVCKVAELETELAEQRSRLSRLDDEKGYVDAGP